MQSGDIDSAGHQLELKLAAKVDGLLDEITERIQDLFLAGWRKIRVVTDHGWILTPKSMTKVDLPKYLTETRWGRCALIKESVDSGYQQVKWFWNPNVSIAMAPGVSSFKAGQNYDHGGLSLQECLTPVIELRNKESNRAVSSASASIADIRWLGLTCKLKVVTEDESIVAVLRTDAGNPATEISKRKPVLDGKCNLIVEDQHEGKIAVLVLLDESGHVLAKKATLVGED